MKRINYMIITLLCCYAGGVIAQTPQELKSWLPAISGWTISEEVEVFNPDNLFDRINGAAPLFIENNFREMTSMEYKRGNDYITIQAYRHASPEDAFGMYASERSSGLKQHAIGGEAQGDEGNLFFFAGDIYVKMWSRSEASVENTLLEIGKGLANRIDSNASYPALLRLFPSEGKEPYTEAYITANYIGHEFLSHVYLAKYKNDGKAFQLFLIDGKTPDKIKEILTQYYTFARQPLEFQEGELVIKDRYNGDIPAIWKGRYLIGIYSENGNDVGAQKWLNELGAKL
ncbi:hypothetical protein LJC57_03255 [Parabacteroides sp. OttesenSCG-928-G07]|nr:hypothetical protein [Parabacteroides sp. OttesenSCG-928-G21]MDL2277589.1 hypothetical protein [Parabacteroides sp. OttesenSCG-928-G07]